MGAAIFCALALVPIAKAQEAQPISIQEIYADWVVSCATAGEGDAKTKSCQMFQELHKTDTNQRVLAIAISPARGSISTKATVVAPFGLALAEGLHVDVAESELMRGPFSTCLPAGCIVEIDISNDTIKTLAANDKATVVATIKGENQPMRTDISLKGFTSAWNRLVALAK